MMRGTRGYIRGGRGISSYRGHSTSNYRGNSGGGHTGYNPNHNNYNRDHSTGGGIGGGRYSGGGGGGMMNESRGRGGFDNSFNSSSSSRYVSPRYQGNNPQPDAYNKRPYPSTHSSRDRSPDRKRNRSESSRRTDDYGPNNSSYNSGGSGGGGGNSYHNRYDGNTSSGFNPNRRYDSSSSRGSSTQTLHHRVAYRPSQAGDDHVSGRPTRNTNDRYEPPAHHHQPQHHQHHHHHNNHGGSSSSHFSPPVRRPYVSRGGPSNRVSSTYTTYRGRGTTYGRGTSVRRPYGTTLHARSSTGGYGGAAAHLSSSSSYVRRTTTTGASDPSIRRKVLVPRLSTATDLARKLKIAKLRSTIRKNNEKKNANAATADGDADSDTDAGQVKKAKTELNDDDEEEEEEDDPVDDDGVEVKDEDDETVPDGVDQDDEDAANTEAEKKTPSTKRPPARKVDAAKGRGVRKPIVHDDDVDEDELQLDNEADDEDIVADRDADDDNKPEYAVQKRTRNYIELNCVHCRRSYFTMKSYNFHLYGSQHKSALFQTAQRQKGQVARIRAQQRRAQRVLEDAHDGDALTLGAPQFCLVCRLNYRSDVAEHQQSMEHRQIKRILKPSCRVCQVGFNCPMDYEVHRASLEHLKVEAELSTKEIRDSVDVNWGEFQTVDSIGDVDDAELLKSADDEAAVNADDVAEDVKEEQDDGDSATVVEKPKKKPHKVAEPKEPVNIGVEMIREITVMFCDVCGTTLTQRTDPEVTLRNHCRWRTHIMLYNQHLQAEERRESRKRKQLQLERATTEKRKKSTTTTTTAGSETSGSTTTTKNGSAATTAVADVAAAATTDDDDAEAAKKTAEETAVSSKPDADGKADEVDEDDDDEDVVDDKTWADVDKDLGELLQAVSSENANDDEDEDSTTNTERYDRFKNSEHEKSEGTTIAATDKGKVAVGSDLSKKTTGSAAVETNAANAADGNKTKAGNGVTAVI